MRPFVAFPQEARKRKRASAVASTSGMSLSAHRLLIQVRVGVSFRFCCRALAIPSNRSAHFQRSLQSGISWQSLLFPSRGKLWSILEHRCRAKFWQHDEAVSGWAADLSLTLLASSSEPSVAILEIWYGL